MGAKQRLRKVCEDRALTSSEASDSWYSKVVVRCGDLAAPKLGLSEADWSELVKCVGVVFNLGAEVNWVKPYAAMAATNVGGTRGALELAAEAHASHLFASSITASADEGSFNTGYRHSKLVSEVL